MSANDCFPSAASAAATPAGSGTLGSCCIETIGVGNAVGVTVAGSARRVAVDAGSIAGRLSIGDSSQRQNFESLIGPHALQAPMAASAKAPRGGRLTRAGWTA